MRILVWSKRAVEAAIRANSVLHMIDSNKVSKLIGNGVLHQNCAAIIDYKLYSINEFFNSSKIICLNGITDTRNLGSIIRSAAVFQWKNIVLSTKGKASLNGTVAKVSCGALHYVKIAICNIDSALFQFIKKGFQIVGLSENGKNEIPQAKKRVIVVGDEHKGITTKHCQYMLSLSHNTFSTLNASVASAIAMYSLR